LRGQGFLDQLIELQPTNFNGVQLSGLIGKAGVSRAARSEQIIFVNGRAIDNLSVQHGIREGYHTALMKGQYAVTFLFLELDPEKVDVNVHPAKREVRFREPDQIRNAVASAVRGGLESDRQRWSAGFQHSNHTSAENQTAPIPPKPVSDGNEPSAPLIPLSEQFALRKDWATFPVSAPGKPPPSVSIPAVAPASPVEPPEEFKILGVLGKLYVLLESDKGLVLVDQHAAHERILFERLRAQLEQAGAAAQRLLIPITLPVAPRDYDWLLANSDTLEKMGFLIEPFGSSTIKIDGLPQMFQCDQPATAVRQLIDELRSHTALTSKLRLSEDVIAKTVCRHAIKANDDLRIPEIEQLIVDLLACDLPYCCPHGRPTMIEIGYPELEKKFGRRV
jgi:DNA mismatch repair protein MutL